eukprot:1191376-Prorocentrum_minimum.AAC.1
MTDQSDAGSVGIFSWRTNQMYYLAGGPPPRPSAEGLRTPRAPHKLFRRESAGKMRGNAGKCGKIRENSENFETPTGFYRHPLCLRRALPYRAQGCKSVGKMHAADLSSRLRLLTIGSDRGWGAGVTGCATSSPAGGR